jgi:hypothetical protein
MTCWAFFLIAGLLLLAWVKESRRFVCFILVGVLAATLIFPTPSFAQFGFLGGIQNLLNVINGTIRQALNVVGAVTAALQNLQQQIVWPAHLIQQARATINSLITQSRRILQSIYHLPLHAATLPVTTDLEVVMRNGRTDDFGTLGQDFSRSYGSIPNAADVDPAMRNLTDADDAIALGTLKTVKASDRASELILQTANDLEDRARFAAPGSAPFLTAAAMTANIQSQALMQKMLAALIRQEAARMAHDNATRKRQTLLLRNAQQNVSGVLNRR